MKENEDEKKSSIWSKDAIKDKNKIVKFFGGNISKGNLDDIYEPLKDRFKDADINLHYKERDFNNGEPDKALMPAMTKSYNTLTAATFPLAKELKENPVDFTQYISECLAKEINKIHMEKHGIIEKNDENRDDVLSSISNPVTIELRNKFVTQ